MANLIPGCVCPLCDGERWVCEAHPTMPFEACGCGIGVPCRVCNPCDADHAPALPPSREHAERRDDGGTGWF